MRHPSGGDKRWFCTGIISVVLFHLLADEVVKRPDASRRVV